MQKKFLGLVLLAMGITGMGLSGYIFVTGTGGRIHLVEVTSYLVLGAACFFGGINYLYESANTFTEKNLNLSPELDEVSPIQQQWRTIHISKQPASQTKSSKITAEAV